MMKKVKKEKAKKGFNIFEEDEHSAAGTEEELPKDEAGRRKIKRQYEDLLGIRIQKLRGRILNRERNVFRLVAFRLQKDRRVRAESLRPLARPRGFRSGAGLPSA